MEATPPATMAGMRSGAAVVRGIVDVNPSHPHTPAHGTVTLVADTAKPDTAVALSELFATPPSKADP